MARYVRTNIVIDEGLVSKVMERFALSSKRAAIDFALHAVLGEGEGSPTDPWRAALELEGTWSDMTDEEAREIWGAEVPDGPNAERPISPGAS